MAMSKAQSVAFGIGAIGKDFMYAITATFVLYYYQNLLGISATFVGIILMVARLFDAFNDPLMGVVVAKTNTRWGRFRPWIFSGSIINALVCFFLFAVPDGMDTGASLMVWFAVAYILWGLTYTLMDIPFWSMVPACTDTPKEREDLSVIGRTCAGIGGMVINSFGLIIAQFLGAGNLRQGFTLFALCVSIAFVVFEIICVVGVRERHGVAMETSGIGDMLKALIRNDQAVVVVVMILIVNASVYLTTNLLIYFFQYNVAIANWEVTYSLFTLVGTLIQILTMSVLYPLGRKWFSNPTLFKASLIIWILGFGLVFLYSLIGWDKEPLLLLFTTPLIYVPFGITTVLTTVFLSGTVDYGELKTGHRDESVIFSMQTFIVKAASALAIFIVGVGLDAIGLVTTNEVIENPDLAAQAVYNEYGEVDMLTGGVDTIPGSNADNSLSADSYDGYIVVYSSEQAINEGADPVTVIQAPGTRFALVFIMTIIPIIGITIGLLFFTKKYKLTDEIMELNAQKVLENRIMNTQKFAETGEAPKGVSISFNDDGTLPSAGQAEVLAKRDLAVYMGQIEMMRKRALDRIDPLDPMAEELKGSINRDFDMLLDPEQSFTPEFIAETRERALATIDPNDPRAEELAKMMNDDFDLLSTLNPGRVQKYLGDAAEKTTADEQ